MTSFLRALLTLGLARTAACAAASSTSALAEREARTKRTSAMWVAQLSWRVQRVGREWKGKRERMSRRRRALPRTVEEAEEEDSEGGESGERGVKRAVEEKDVRSEEPMEVKKIRRTHPGHFVDKQFPPNPQRLPARRPLSSPPRRPADSRTLTSSASSPTRPTSPQPTPELPAFLPLLYPPYAAGSRSVRSRASAALGARQGLLLADTASGTRRVARAALLLLIRRTRRLGSAPKHGRTRPSPHAPCSASLLRSLP